MFPLTNLLILSFVLSSMTACFILLNKTSLKSNGCCNSFNTLLGLRPLPFNKSCIDFQCCIMKGLFFSCFLRTFLFRDVTVFSILHFFFQIITFSSFHISFGKFYHYVGIFFSKKTLLF